MSYLGKAPSPALLTSSEVTTALGFTPYNAASLSTDLNPYLLSATASSTYLTQSSAASTYQTQSGMSSYLTTSTAASTYLTQSNATSTYLTQASAALTYQTQSGMSSYLTTSTAASTYAPSSTAVTLTGSQTLTNKTLTSPIFTNAKATTIRETVTVSATAATGTINYDALTQSVLYYTTNASGNFTINVRGSSGATLDSTLAVGESVTVAFLCTNGSTAYYHTGFQVDGTSVTPKWQGGTAPASGNTSAIDLYTYTIVKTASATFTVFAAQTKFA